jgi:hypothetical protein
VRVKLVYTKSKLKSLRALPLDFDSTPHAGTMSFRN